MYAKHPHLDGTGTVSIATPTGTVEAVMVDGIIDWPDNTPLPNAKSFRLEPTDPPEQLRAMKEAQEREQLETLAARHGLKLVADKAVPDRTAKTAK